MKWTNEFLDGKRLIMDPVADEVVARVVEEHGPEEAKNLFRVLIRNIDIPFDQVPAYVADYMQANAALPGDADAARILRGQEVFADHGPMMALLLYYKSLPTCYLNWRGAQVLALTGRLDRGRDWPEVYARRIVETTQFLMDVMTPGHLRPGAPGIRTILKVRLVHASIRHFILREDRWNRGQWQLPINQEDLAMTLMTFSISLIDGLEQIGRPLSAAEAEDFLYAWRQAGHVLGILPGMIPTGVGDGRALLERTLVRHAGVSTAGQDLTRALLAFGRMMFRSRAFRNAPPVLLHYFLGAEKAELLGVRQRKGCLAKLLPDALSESSELSDALRSRSKKLDQLMDRIGRRLLFAMMNHMNKMKGQGLHVGESLREKWEIERL